jgi:hypothetical protein
MISYAMDHPPPSTFILITGDRDFAYALSMLRNRQYEVVLLAPSLPTVHTSLQSQASIIFDWNSEILGKIATGATQTLPRRQSISVAGQPLASPHSASALSASKLDHTLKGSVGHWIQNLNDVSRSSVEGNPQRTDVLCFDQDGSPDPIAGPLPDFAPSPVADKLNWWTTLTRQPFRQILDQGNIGLSITKFIVRHLLTVEWRCSG